MKKLHHENIVKLIDYKESQNNCYIIMEYQSRRFRRYLNFLKRNLGLLENRKLIPE